MNENNVRTNSLKAWLLAARPKTLSGAAVPVILGIALAFAYGGWRNFQVVPAVLCLAFAWVMQIDSNFINDYFDFIHGNDNPAERLGPKRACAEGWITASAMRKGLAVTTAIGCAIGLPLVLYGGWEMIVIGILCVAFAFLYTLKFSYLGLGDLLVLVFFGVIPVCLTFYLILPREIQMIPWFVVTVSVACGLVIDTLLTINNFRDRDNDAHDGKMTLVVRLGAKRAHKLYALLGLVAVLLMYCVNGIIGRHALTTTLIDFIAALLYLIPHLRTARQMWQINQGRALNRILGMTARNMFIFGIVWSAAIIIASL